MVYIGVDACKVGWFAVTLIDKTNWRVNIFPNISTLWSRSKEANLILIDIPIGLRENDSRERICDKEARKLLIPKLKPSVFVAPCRAAIYSKNDEEAKVINVEQTGRSLSMQALRIIPKIKQVDQFLLGDKTARKHIREIHPEICFWALNGKKSMAFSKKDESGIRERKEVLISVYPYCEDILNYTEQECLHKEVARDDILDAMAAAVTASMEKEGLLTIPDNPELDSKGLPMEMVYFPVS